MDSRRPSRTRIQGEPGTNRPVPWQQRYKTISRRRNFTILWMKMSGRHWGRFRACLRGGGGPQTEVRPTCGGSNLDERFYGQAGYPPKRLTSPTWGPPTQCKQALRKPKHTKWNIKKDSNCSFVEKIWKFKLSIFQRVEFSIADTQKPG